MKKQEPQIILQGNGTVSRYLHTQTPLDTPPEWNGQTALAKWKLYNGPAKETLRRMDTESVDCVVTSPPYFWLRDYKVEGQIGLEDSVDGYVTSITDVMSEVFRVLKEDGVLFLNLGDTYYSGKGESQGKDKKNYKRRFGLRAVDKSGGLGLGIQRKSIIGIPWRVALKMCEQKWILRSPIIWHRVNCLLEPVKDRPSRSYENIFMFVKSRFYYFNKEVLRQNNPEDVWDIAIKPKSNIQLDTAPYPEELVKKCLDLGCKKRGTVLDPFAGSGTTMRVALASQCSCVGIELNKDFCNYIIHTL